MGLPMGQELKSCDCSYGDQFLVIVELVSTVWRRPSAQCVCSMHDYYCMNEQHNILLVTEYLCLVEDSIPRGQPAVN